MTAKKKLRESVTQQLRRSVSVVSFSFFFFLAQRFVTFLYHGSRLPTIERASGRSGSFKAAGGENNRYGVDRFDKTNDIFLALALAIGTIAVYVASRIRRAYDILTTE